MSPKPWMRSEWRIPALRIRFTVAGLATLLFLAVPMAQAQWTTSGNNIYNSNSGNVGVGTTAPASKLEVSTTGGLNRLMMISDTSQYNVLTFQRGSNIKGEVGMDTSDGFYIWSNGAYRLWVNSSGDMTIGGSLTVNGNIAAKYQDIAEWVAASEPIAPGTVVVLDPDRANAVTPSAQEYDTRVAGVISATPGIVLGEEEDGKVKVATTGRVKVRVDASGAAIRVGDLLVTSPKTGTAMKSEPLLVGGVPLHRPGTLIGKALEPLPEGEGQILVLLSLQ